MESFGLRNWLKNSNLNLRMKNSFNTKIAQKYDQGHCLRYMEFPDYQGSDAKDKNDLFAIDQSFQKMFWNENYVIELNSLFSQKRDCKRERKFNIIFFIFLALPLYGNHREMNYKRSFMKKTFNSYPWKTTFAKKMLVKKWRKDSISTFFVLKTDFWTSLCS